MSESSSRDGRGRRVRRLVVRGSTAIFAQGLSSIANLAVSLAVARLLGPAELGRFAILFGILQVAVALQTHGVGDTLTVLDRNRPGIRNCLHIAQHGHQISGIIISVVLALLLAGSSLPEATTFGILVAAWEYEEYGRRILMARLEFSLQVLSDGTYLLLAAGGVVGIALLVRPSLILLLLVMALAALVSGIVSQLLVPREERLAVPRRPISREAMRDVFAYGAWRSLSATLGNLSQLGTRLIVSASTTLVVLGNIEAGRLMVAPLMTFTAALGNILVPLIAERRRERVESPGKLGLLTVGGGAIAAAYGVAVIVFSDSVTRLLAGPEFAPGVVVVAGWVATAVVLAVTNTATSASIVLLASKSVFIWRGLGTLLSLCLSATAAISGHPELVPAALAVGAAATGLSLSYRLRVLERTSESPT